MARLAGGIVLCGITSNKGMLGWNGNWQLQSTDDTMLADQNVNFDAAFRGQWAPRKFSRARRTADSATNASNDGGISAWRNSINYLDGYMQTMIARILSAGPVARWWRQLPLISPIRIRPR
jgi:hypothetical protein